MDKKYERIAARIIPVPHFVQTPGLCGASALRSILSYWGKEFSEQELAEKSNSSVEDGVEAPGLLEAAGLVGFKGFYHDDADLDDLRYFVDLGIPVIVDWWSTDSGHYSVVVGVDDDYVYMVDPNKDKHYSRIPLEKFKQNWFDFEDLDETRGLSRRRLIVVTPEKII